MPFLTVISLILVVTALSYVLYQKGIVRVCPICAGIASMWIVLIALRIAGWPVDPAVLALLLGGSAVGMSFSLEKRRHMHPLVKATFIVVGLLFAHNIVIENWPLALIDAAVLSAFSYFIMKDNSGGDDSGKNDELVKNMDDCC